MPTRSASIGARLSLDRTAFTQGLSSAESDAHRFAGGLGRITATQNRWTEFASKLDVAGFALKGLSIAGGAVKKFFDADISVEKLAGSLSAVSDGSETVAQQFAALREASKLPGVGMAELGQSSAALQGVGLSAKASRDAMVEFGNALATAGKGKAELAGVADAITDMFGAGMVESDQIDRISGVFPKFRAMIGNLDRSDPSKFIQGVIEELRKLPRAATSGQDAVDNLGDSFDQLIGKISGGKVGKIGAGIMRGLSDAMDADGALGKMKAMYDGLHQAGMQIAAAELDGPFAKYEITAEEGERRRKEREDAAAAAAAARLKAAQDIFAQDKAELDLQLKIAQAQTSGNREEAKALEDQLFVTKNLEKVQKSLNITTEEATKLLKDQAAAQRAVKDADPNAAASRKKTTEDEKIADLRSRGRNRQADKLEEKQTQDARTRQLLDNGFSGKDAQKITESESRRRRRQEHFEKTGRRLIGGARNPDDHKYTIDNAIRTDNSFTNDYRFFPPRPPEEQTEKQSDRAMFRQTGKIGGLSLNTPNDRASTRDQDWTQVDGLNGNPAPPPRDRIIRGAGRKKDEVSAETEGLRSNNKMQPSTKDFDSSREIIAQLKTNNDLLRQIAGAGSVGSKTAPQSSR